MRDIRKKIVKKSHGWKGWIPEDVKPCEVFKWGSPYRVLERNFFVFLHRKYPKYSRITITVTIENEKA